MILQLFTIFPSVRAYLDELQTKQIHLEDEIRFWRSKCDAAEIDRDKARAEATSTYKTFANYQAMITGSPILPFPEIMAPQNDQIGPTQWVPQSLGSNKRFARDIQLEEVAKSRAEALKRRQVRNNEPAAS
jgi:hypothetical protein